MEEILKKIPEEKQAEAQMIYNELKFILQTLKKLKQEIKSAGPIENFEQGKQKFLRESPALTGYNKLMKTYDTFYKNLINLLPKNESTPDDFENDDL